MSREKKPLIIFIKTGSLLLSTALLVVSSAALFSPEFLEESTDFQKSMVVGGVLLGCIGVTASTLSFCIPCSNIEESVTASDSRSAPGP